MEQYTEQEQVRMEKVEKIREYCNPYPERYEKSHALKEARLLEDWENLVLFGFGI